MAHSLADADIWIRQGHPIRVEWMGWSTDTFRLSKCGWQMATQDNYYGDSMDVVLRHPLGFVGRGCLRNYRRILDTLTSDFRYAIDALNHAVINLEYMASEKSLFIQSEIEPFAEMKWRDMEPVETGLNRRDWKISDISLFRELAAPVEKELIVEPEDVQRALDLILNAQQHGMKEIRARDRRREHDNGVKQVHAQIITLKAA